MADFNLNSDMAYFLGVIAGDGYAGKNRIEVKTCDYKFLTDIYIPLIEKLFDIRPRLAKESSGLNAHRVYFNSKDIFEFLCKLNLKSPKAFTVSMPYAIKGNRKLEIAFARGVFDTDGNINTRNNKFTVNYPTISLGSRSSKLIIEIATLLKTLGLNARITHHSDKGKPYYLVRLYGFEQLAAFNSIVGFLNPYKAQKSRETQEKGPLRAGNSIR